MSSREEDRLSFNDYKIVSINELDTARTHSWNI